jgi:PAS domain S-box-containing protein
MADRAHRNLLYNLGLAAAYLATGRLGLELAGYAHSISLVWPPAGIALAALAVGGRALWPGVALGAFAVNLWTGVGLWVSLGVATGSTLGALVGLAVFDRGGQRAPLTRRQDIARLVAAAACFPLVSASVGVASLELGGVVPPAQTAGAWLWWWVGDAMGILLVAPVLLTWLSSSHRASPRSPLETAALAVALGAVNVLVFFDLVSSDRAGEPLTFAVAPPLAWAAARFGPRGTAPAVVATAAIAIVGTLAGAGPFGGYPLQQGLLLLVLFVGVMGSTAFLLASEVAEREQVLASLVEEKRARARGERELRHSEERFRLLSDSVVDIIGEYDAAGNVLYLSPSFSAVLGHPVEAMLSKGVRRTLAEFVHPDDLAAVSEALAGVAASKGAGTRLLFRARHADGEFRWLETLAQSFEAADGTLHVVSVNRDVTDRVRAEQEASRLREHVLEARKLESLGVLAGGIAHDFNNLLAVILGNVSHAQGELPGDSPLRAALGDVETAALKAAALTDHMLAYAGRGPVDRQVVDLSELVEDTAARMRGALSQQAQLGLELARDLPAIECDPAQIRQLVGNLLGNAGEALGAAPGRIHVETRRGEPSGDEVVLEVRDTGCGMDEATRTRMFDPFFSTKFAGRGLGLSAVQGIVRHHRGSIEVESQPEQGTLVRVRLPVAPGRAAPAPGPSPAEGARAGDTVLVVDDEPAVRNLARRVLTRAGFTVLCASSGEEALERFRERSGEVRAVVLDLTMPGLSGAEVLAALRGLRPDLPVVVCSGWSEAESAARLRDQRPDAIVAKPYDARALVARLHEVIAKRS